ncbi:FAD-dependent oxidoreductase [Nocardia colli]|uniref:FAD-dependent oxidoreductase n=1 Tax=Nocardia colli TaxID=2545717 RepID=A0A5N0E801_9NOCA|nr:FAD-dependent oxidoreductase [Nocardia colli]KAA8885552.1 FAD-dependent oxidoreductase [Nocardia colli]
MSTPERVAVVGAGVCGIAAALALHRAGCAVEILERDDRIGGRLGVAELGDGEILLGGKNIGRRYTRFRALLALLGGTGYEPFGINTSRVVAGRLVRLDSDNRVTTMNGILRMCDWRDLTALDRIARKVKSADQARFLGSDLARKLGRHDDRPLSAHFGKRTSANFLRPITVRMNGAEPDEAYYGNFPTNMGMLIDTFDQPTTGLSTLLARIADLVEIRYRTTVTGITRLDGGVVLHLFDAGGRATQARYDAVAVCTPAHAAAPLLAPLSDTVAGLLHSVRYFPATVAVVRYTHDVFAADVRAIALDDQPCSNAGSYGKDTRNVVRYTFSGKHGRLTDPADADVLGLVTDTEHQLRTHLGTVPQPRTAAAIRHWPHAYCGYLPHHGDFLDALSDAFAPLTGIALAGDYLLGASVEACCRSGENAAAAVLSTTRQGPVGCES